MQQLIEVIISFISISSILQLTLIVPPCRSGLPSQDSHLRRWPTLLPTLSGACLSLGWPAHKPGGLLATPPPNPLPFSPGLAFPWAWPARRPGGLLATPPSNPPQSSPGLALPAACPPARALTRGRWRADLLCAEVQSAHRRPALRAW